MQLIKQVSVFAAAAAVASAANTEIAYVTAFFDDLKANSAEYLSYIGAGASVPAALLELYEEANTYTDDSYTTLIGSDFPITDLENFATGLPWYSSRLSAELNAATAGATSTAKAISSSSSSSVAVTSATSTKAATSSKAAPSSSVVAESSSVVAESSAVPSVSSANSGSSIGFAGQSNAMILVPLALVSACAFLL